MSHFPLNQFLNIANVATDNNPIKNVRDAKFKLDLEVTSETVIQVARTKEINAANDSLIGLNKDKTFANFVTGACNQLAASFCHAIARAPGHLGKYPCLLLHGNSGLGKTHLCHATANAIAENYPELRICYLTARTLQGEMVDFISRNDIHGFIKKFTNSYDVLIIDDIHDLKGGVTLDHFFHIFNDLTAKGKQIIFTCDKKPDDIEKFEDRIKTRLLSGLTAEIKIPDFETRIAIMKKWCQQNDFFLHNDIVYLLSHHFDRSIREFEGALLKLSAITKMQNAELDILTVKEILGITVDLILLETALHFSVLVADVKSDTRKKETTLARQVACFLLKKHLSLSYADIGAILGNRNHTTIMHSVDKIKSGMKFNQELQLSIRTIEEKL
jgi:chromosomal replication initiator protein